MPMTSARTLMAVADVEEDAVDSEGVVDVEEDVIMAGVEGDVIMADVEEDVVVADVEEDVVEAAALAPRSTDRLPSSRATRLRSTKAQLHFMTKHCMS